jgi:predicted nucleic acid-binding protein
MALDDILMVYWDASALLSALFQDAHSHEARKYADAEGLHLISSLGFAETLAVIARLSRDGHLNNAQIKSSLRMLDAGKWRKANIWPRWEQLKSLSNKWPLRGADLWHLATAKALQATIPELILLSFDVRLDAAARGEGLRPSNAY